MAVPFVYFSFLAICLYNRRKTVDLAIFICILYASSGFIGLFMNDYGSLVENYNISFVAAFSYCALLSLCLYPVAKFSHLRIQYIRPVKNVRFLKALAWAAILWFIIYVIASYRLFVEIITGDLLALRTALYNETLDVGFITTVPGPIRFFISALSFVFGCGWILIFLAFFSLLVQKLPKKYFFFFLIASLYTPWGAVLGIDRSAVAAYLLSFIGVIVFFWPFMQKKIKKSVIIVGVVFIGGLISYLVTMTLARFGGVSGDDTERVNDSLIFYLGHGYLYFCYYFDNFDNPYKMSNLILPFINKFLFGDELLGGMRINYFLEKELGMEFGYFYTFVGQIQIVSGHIVAILFCLFLFVSGNVVLGRIKNGIVTPRYSFLSFFFASFLILGLFSYYYQTPPKTFSVVFFLIFFYILGFENGPFDSTDDQNTIDPNSNDEIDSSKLLI